MEDVTIYGRNSCGFCHMAKQLCDRRGVPYRYVNIEAEGITKQDLSEKAGKPVFTVPQIFVGNEHIGGFDQFSEFVAQTA